MDNTFLHPQLLKYIHPFSTTSSLNGIVWGGAYPSWHRVRSGSTWSPGHHRADTHTHNPFTTTTSLRTGGGSWSTRREPRRAWRKAGENMRRTLGEHGDSTRKGPRLERNPGSSLTVTVWWKLNEEDEDGVADVIKSLLRKNPRAANMWIQDTAWISINPSISRIHICPNSLRIMAWTHSVLQWHHFLWVGQSLKTLLSWEDWKSFSRARWLWHRPAPPRTRVGVRLSPSDITTAS